MSAFHQFWHMLGEASAPVVPPAPVDYSIFASFCKSYAPGASTEVFPDISGHGKSLIAQSAGRFTQLIDPATGRQAYYGTQAQENASWKLPELSLTNGNYDVITAFRVESASETYLTLLSDDTQDFTYGQTYTGLNCYEIKTLFQTAPKGPVFESVGQTVVVRHRLNAQTGASVEVNGQIVIPASADTAYRAAKVVGGSAFNQSGGHVLRGHQFAWGLFLGNMSEAQWEPVRAALMSELGI